MQRTLKEIKLTRHRRVGADFGSSDRRRLSPLCGRRHLLRFYPELRASVRSKRAGTSEFPWAARTMIDETGICFGPASVIQLSSRRVKSRISNRHGRDS